MNQQLAAERSGLVEGEVEIDMSHNREGTSRMLITTVTNFIGGQIDTCGRPHGPLDFDAQVIAATRAVEVVGMVGRDVDDSPAVVAEVADGSLNRVHFHRAPYRGGCRAGSLGLRSFEWAGAVAVKPIMSC